MLELQKRDNEISLRKLPGGTTQLRTLKGTLIQSLKNGYDEKCL